MFPASGAHPHTSLERDTPVIGTTERHRCRIAGQDARDGSAHALTTMLRPSLVITEMVAADEAQRKLLSARHTGRVHRHPQASLRKMDHASHRVRHHSLSTRSARPVSAAAMSKQFVRQVWHQRAILHPKINSGNDAVRRRRAASWHLNDRFRVSSCNRASGSGCWLHDVLQAK